MSSVSSSFNIDGIVSGINTSQIVSQLIAIERRPQDLTKLRQSKFSEQDAALGSIKTKMSALKTSSLSVSTGADWTALKATSSNTDLVGVSATAASGVGSLTFTVDSLASADAYASGWTVSATTSEVVAAPGGGGARTITVGVGTDSRTIDVGDGSLEAVVNAINNQSNFKVSASAVKVGNDSYRLQLNGAEGGASNTLSFTAAEFSPGSSWLHVATATDAQITVGSGVNSFSVTSNSNSMADVLPGVTLELKGTTAPGQTVTVGSSRNGEVLADQVNKMITDLNTVMLEINTQTKYDAATKKAAPLLDSSAVRQVRQLVTEAVSGSSGETSVALAGITLAANGTIEFDRAKFIEAFTKDPVATQALFTDGTVAGIGKRVYDAADRATSLDAGLLTSAQDAVKATVEALQLSIDGMQQRLDRRAVTIRNQFNAMETALSALRSQGNWLSSQLSTG